jgi:hypothetical protein
MENAMDVFRTPRRAQSKYVVTEMRILNCSSKTRQPQEAKSDQFISRLKIQVS